jgi:hypothetical protein
VALFRQSVSGASAPSPRSQPHQVYSSQGLPEPRPKPLVVGELEGNVDQAITCEAGSGLDEGEVAMEEEQDSDPWAEEGMGGDVQ